MATKKPTRTKRRKTAAHKPIARRRTKPAKKVVAAKKAAVRRATHKKKPQPRAATVRKARAARGPSRPPKPAVSAAVPVPLADAERVGTVTHYYGHLSVAAVRIEASNLRVGDMIHIVGHTSDFRQRVESLQIEHEAVAEAHAGQEVGLRVTEHAREHDVVYRLAPAQS
jgi:translation elongation factor EF-Tu-like GTPase